MGIDWVVIGFIALMSLFTFGAGKPGTELNDYMDWDTFKTEQVQENIDG